LGAAVPYPIAAKFAHPDRAVVGLVGDSAMQMKNMAEFITVAKYWREWVAASVVLKKPPQARVLEFKFEVAFAHFRNTRELGIDIAKPARGRYFPRPASGLPPPTLPPDHPGPP
jgi:hypothetical protein